MTNMESSFASRIPSSVHLLLKQTFGSTVELPETPLSQKRLRLALENVEGVAEKLPGISANELLENPFIHLSISRLLKILQDVFHKEVICSEDSLQNTNEDKGDDLIASEKDISVIENALKELSYLTDYTWEQLNIGHWKSVPRIWRKLYTCLAILKVCFLVLKRSSNLEVIKECDMGILMGEPICQNVLRKIAEEVSSRIITEANCNNCETLGTSNPAVVDYDKICLRNKSSNEFEVVVAKKPSLEEFLSFMKTKTPVLLTNTIDYWPALKKWNVEYIRKIAGFRTVPVEVGQKYTSEDWTQKVMSISEFIDKYMQASTESNENQCQNDIGYIAQYHLFTQLPELRKDIRIPEYCALGSTSDHEKIEINAWFGPANTISPTHYDPNHNILVQVFGSKIIRLFPPSESSKLQPHSDSSLLFNTSQLDIEQDDLFLAHPEMRNAKHCDIMLRAGKSLYIPPRWWHYVKSLEPSFSVSFWFE
ncbi:unnamed protein product [Orchesella dallaii]|uniref:JmjC domain-containing protein 5 n=1 Tax=Orchesella dallaii TaxID=48710 RepID=A0ABP1S4I3_9HEXA